MRTTRRRGNDGVPRLVIWGSTARVQVTVWSGARTTYDVQMLPASANPNTAFWRGTTRYVGTDPRKAAEEIRSGLAEPIPPDVARKVSRFLSKG